MHLLCRMSTIDITNYTRFFVTIMLLKFKWNKLKTLEKLKKLLLILERIIKITY
jgi:hypothetical protein